MLRLHLGFDERERLLAYLDVLQRWNNLPHSPLEQIEKLEQLRLIEAGIEIGSFTVAEESLSVDTAEQLEQARAIAAGLRA